MPSAVYMTETFTDADGTEIDAHTSDSGHSWTETTGFGTNNNAGKITSNALQSANANGSQYYSSYVPQSADYSVFCDVTFNGAKTAGLTSISLMYLEARKSADNVFNCYRWRFLVDQNSDNIEFRLQGAANDATTAFSSVALGTSANNMIYYTVAAGSVGTVYRMELRMIGSTISGFVNGVLRCEGTHTGVTAAGRPCVSIAGNTTTGKAITVDNYYTVERSSAGQCVARQAVTRSATR